MNIEKGKPDTRTFPICPVCGLSGMLSFQAENLAFYQCPDCKVLFPQKNQQLNSEESENPELYEKEYFNEQYKEQYGLSYWEDQFNIENLAHIRLNRLLKCLKSSRPEELKRMSICDLGCALGFFLKEARKIGFGKVHGVEVSNYASKTCQNVFELDVEKSSLLDWTSSTDYDVVTMFYVLEHFPEQSVILEKVQKALKKGGYLVLALPSTTGPHFRFQNQDWILNHPLDHFVDYNPRSIKKVLARYGFRVKQIYPSAVKYNRVFGKDNIFFKSPLGKSIWRFAAAVFRPFNFGDTMEVYAQRVE